MASIDRPSSTVTFARLRALPDRLWRPLAAQRPAVKWGLAVVGFLALAAVSYWGAGSLSNIGVRYLASSKRFWSDDLIKVCRALDKLRIAYRVDDQRRVEVAADQFDQAAEAVSKLELGQQPIGVIRDDSSSIGFWDGAEERERKEKLRLEKILERLISDQEGVLGLLVSIDRPHANAFSRNNAKPTAFVYVETEGGRALPYRTIQAIPTILAANVRDLAPGSITVMDKRGNRYLEPGNPTLGDNSRNRAREEEISEEILEKLDWIKGVRVQVQVISRHPGYSPTSTAPGAGGKANGQSVVNALSSRGDAGSRELPPLPPQTVMAANRPILIEGDREASSVPSTIPAAPAAAGKGASSLHVSEGQGERGHVVIHVPRSFYFKMQIRSDDRDPSPEERQVMAERTERQIRTAVALVLPGSEPWKVDVDTIPDDPALSRPAILASASDSRQRFLEWGIIGGLGVVVSIVAIAGSWMHVARRPARAPEPAGTGRRYHVDSASQPSPSERVRELIERNPEAAASVLQRWVGQGGRSS